MNKMTAFIDGYGDKYTVSSDGIITSMYRWSNIHGKMMRVGTPKTLKPTADKK